MRKRALAIGATFFVAVGAFPGHAADEFPPKPAVALTLIPPSPVTDRIVLDVRGTVRNLTDGPRAYHLAVYRDREEPGALLLEERLELAPGEASGVRLRWPTEGHAGEHRIVLVARGGGQELRAEEPIEILAAGQRSTRRLGGAWVDLYHHDELEGQPFNVELGKMTDDGWRELVRAMHDVEQDVLVITMMFQNFTHRGRHSIESEGYPGKAYYPSRLFPGRMQISSPDPLEAILSEADRLGMHVLPGVGCYAFFDYGPGSLRWCKQVADELWQRYGHHRSFYGWYLSHEKDGGLGDAAEREEIVRFFREFTPYVHRLAPDKPVMMAPNCYHLRGAEETYRQLLPHLDIICPFGYHRMPAGDLRGEEAAALMQSLCDETGCHLWMDVESFVFPDGRLVPRPIDGLISDFTRFPSFEKVLHYQFPGLMSGPGMSRQPGGPASVRLYEDYREYLEAVRQGRLPPRSAHDARGKPVALAEPPDARHPGLVFSCREDNDLYRALADGSSKPPRRDGPAAAVEAAPEGAGVLILADGYPEATTDVDPAVLDAAARKKLRVYLEYPARLPDLDVGAPREVRHERGVVVSEIFGEELRPMRIVMLNGCRHVPVRAARPHLVLAKVAGVDTAVFGLEGTSAEPVLFDHPRGDLLVATTCLSRFATARYQPAAAWRTIWRTILGWLQPGAPAVEPRWMPTVAPSFGPGDPLPADVEARALRRSADWILRGRVLRHPGWPEEALDRSLRYNTVLDMPAAEWPPGDGSLGILEGFSSTIRADGSQPMRWAVRNDCTAEVAMLLALDATWGGRPEHGRIAANLLDYILTTSGLAGGPRADPESPSWGLIGWALDHPGSYWGDDNARALLSMGATAAVLGESRWNEATARCILANLRTTGLQGFRPACVTEEQLQAGGWKASWMGRHVHFSPHMQAWIWACYLWLYEQTRFEPLLARTEMGARMMMRAYPGRWDWCLRSGTIERSRILLPLSWLVRVDDTPEHRGWLRRIAEDLVALQDASGAIRETIGDGGPGIHSNAEYGTRETSIIQADGDPVCDMLYSCNFALIGLHEAATATGDAFYSAAEERLAKFLCRIQIRSERHPELDGAWYRAFHFRDWEYWAANADWEWGPWCTETGWTQPWIAGTLALRGRETSLWDLVRKVDLRAPFERLRSRMLPDDALAPPERTRTSHAALGGLVRLAAEPDPRYPGFGAGSLTDGFLAADGHESAEWLGFLGTDVEAVVDLRKPVRILRLELSCLQSTAVGVFPPRRVEFAVSSDGARFEVLKDVEPTQPTGHAPPRSTRVAAEGVDAEARYVRVRAANPGPLPDWVAPGSPPSWIFVDELLVHPQGTAPPVWDR